MSEHAVVGHKAAGAAERQNAPRWRRFLRRLRRQKVGVAAIAAFILIVLACLAAPLFATYVAGTGPNTNHLSDSIVVNGVSVDVVSMEGLPIGPTWGPKFMLGADANGRDVAVRLLYGGLNSLYVGAIATAISAVLGAAFGLVTGYFGGRTDRIITGIMDTIWAFPAILLGIALGTALALGGINLGFVQLREGSLLIAAIIIGVVHIPYMNSVVRSQVLTLSRREFIDAAWLQGAGHTTILIREVLPNVMSTILVFAPIILARSILLEAGLSFLGAGVRPPNPSWGAMISDGIRLMPGAFHLTFFPGLMLVAATLSINVFGDALRDLLDPRGNAAGG